MRRRSSFPFRLPHCNDFQWEFQFRGSSAYRRLRPVEFLSNGRNILRG